MALTKFKNPYKGKKDTPSGVLTEAQAIRHGLTGVAFGGASDKSFRKSYWRSHKGKAMFEAVKSYRQTVHGVHEPRLATTLRDSVHYLMEPMSNTRGGGNYATTEAGGAPAQTILKV